MFLIHSFVEMNKYSTAVRCQGLFWVLGCGDRIVLSQKSVNLFCHVRAWQEHEGRAGRKAGMLGGRGDGGGAWATLFFLDDREDYILSFNPCSGTDPFSSEGFTLFPRTVGAGT